ncbi:MAG TPA: hypothetical protein PLD27_10925 [bacterium]|nr:hypothetical protein [bacterium]
MILFIEYLNRPIYYFFRIFFFLFKKIYFVNCSKYFQNDNSIELLKIKKIYHLNFNSFDTNIIYKYWELARHKILFDLMNKKIINTEFYNFFISYYLKKDYDLIEKFKIAIQYELRNNFEEIIKAYIFFEEFSKNNNNQFFLLTFDNYFIFFKNYFNLSNFRIIYIPFDKIKSTIFILKLVREIILNILKIIARNLFPVIYKKKYKNLTYTQKIALVPHQGVYYGEIYLKDEYYDYNPDSILNPKNILHISIDYCLDWYEKSKKFYEQNNIPNIFLSLILYKTLSFLKVQNNVLKQFIFVFLNDYLIKKTLFNLLVRLIKYDYQIKRFPDLKICLSCFEICIDRTFILALGINKIKTIGMQDRSTDGFITFGHLNFDYYFTAGQHSEKEMLRTSKHYIKHIIPLGLKRFPKIIEFSNIQKTNFQKYLRLKKDKMLVFAFDYHSPESLYEDGQRDVARLKFIIDFYDVLIKLAKKYSNIHILIKPKTARCYSYKTIKFKIEEMEAIPNISIEYEIEKYNIYQTLCYADFTITHCATTIADETLAFGIPNFFYDNIGYFRYLNFPYYTYNLISECYDDLEKKIAKYISEKKYILDEETFYEMRKLLFNYPELKEIKQNTIKYILKILNE